MNTTGCNSPFARDTFLILEGDNVDTSCFLPMPFYFIAMILFSLILGLIAIARTSLACNRNNKRKTGFHSSSLRRNSVLPLIIPCFSWISFVVTILLLILPATYGSSGNVMIFLNGLEYMSFNIISERWLKKLIRLGSKIIIPSPKQDHAAASSDDSASSSTHQAAGGGLEQDSKLLESLTRSDNVLKILDVLIIAGISLQVVCMCVLCMVNPENSLWLHLGVGMQGFNVFLAMSALIWQYQRCASAIVSTTSNLNNVVVVSTPHASKTKPAGLQSVLLKFRKHQLILASFGTPASIVFLLWGISEIPLSYLVIIATGFFDSMVSCGVLVTFVNKRVKARSGGNAVSETRHQHHFNAAMSSSYQLGGSSVL